MDDHADVAAFTLNYILKLGASYAEVRLESTKGSSYLFKNGALQGGGMDTMTGLGVRFLMNNHFGFVSTNLIAKESIRKALRQALLLSKPLQHLRSAVSLSEEEAHQQRYTVNQGIKLDNVSPEARMLLLKEIDTAVIKTKVKVPGRFLSLSDGITKEYLLTSEGTKITTELPRVSFYYFLTLKGKRSVQRYWQYGQTGGWESVTKWKLAETLGNEVVNLNKNMDKGRQAPRGKMDVVCGPQITGIMVHESVGHPYEADRIFGREAAQAGESFVTKDMLGTKIGSEQVNVADDPTLANSNGFYLFDSEGVRARPKLLIKEGMINEFLHNRETAAAMHLKSNGSSRASEYDKESIVRMSNTYFMPGPYQEEELVEDIKEGIYLKSFTEWNIDDKRYNQKYVGAEAYLIKHGKLTVPVFQPVLEIATPVLWKSVDAAADNVEHHAGSCGKGEPMQAIPAWLGGPSIRLRNITMR